MEKLTRTVFLLILLLPCTGYVFAAYFNFRHYGMEDGLPSSTVRSLMQDGKGFMWFGTDNGLSRFDGHSFKNFRSVRDDPFSLGNNYIYALYEDSAQMLWVGTGEGVYIYHPRSEQFRLFSKTTAEGVAIRSHITSIREDRKKNIWFSTFSQGVFFYHRERDILYNYRHHPDDPNSLDSDMILALYIDRSDVVWAAPQRKNGVLNKYDPESDRFIPLQLKIDDGTLNGLGVYAMIEDAGHNFWAGTWDCGLCRLDRNTGRVTSFLKPGTAGGISHIHEIIEYQPDILLIGSDDGLSVFNTHTYENHLMTFSEFKSSTLSDKFIYPMYKDREGGLWVGTYYRGVNYAPPRNGYIEGYSHSKYSNSVGGSIISCFSEDAHGNIWIGSDDGGLSCFHPEEKTFVNYMPEKNRNSLSYYNVHAVCYDEDRLWIGTYSGGLNVLDLKTNRFRHCYSDVNDPNSLYGNSIYSIYKDGDDIWIGTMEGICLYDREKDSFIRMKETGTTTIDIVGDDDENLWFATWGAGLFRYDKSKQAWRHYIHHPSDSVSLPDNQINSLCVDENNTLWLGTDNGPVMYDRQHDAFLTVNTGTDYNSISYIRKVKGELWLATGNGLVSYRLSDGMTRRLCKSDGLQSDRFNMKAGLLSSTGHLYLGTTNGFNILKPEDISGNSHIPPVYITNIQVFNKDLSVEANGVLTASPLYTSRIELSHRENVFSIEYISLSYKSPSGNRYKYRLEGFDREWNEVGNQRKATYTNLPAGKYVFHVIGSNNDGVWNEEGSTLTIVIRPPFRQTAWAYLFYVLLAIGISGFIFYLTRRRNGKKHREHMRQLQVEKEKELHEAKINFFTLVAHEIRTPVSLIIGPLEKIMDDIHALPGLMQDSLQIINRNSQRLLSLVNQLLDFRKAEERAFIIKFSSQNIYDLLTNLCIRFKPLAEHRNITLSLDMEDTDIRAAVDAEALTKIVSNLLTNAIKYAESRIIVSCTSGKDDIIIKVTDDGAGIPPDEQKNIFRPFYQVVQGQKPGTGIGLSLVKLLVDAHHGMVEADSVPGKQTVFTVTLPQRQPVGEDSRQSGTLLSEEIIPGDKQEDATCRKTDGHHARPSLLIAEDSSDMRRFLSDSLRRFYTVTEAGNGKEALDKLKKYPADIIISDIMMPVMDGMEFTRKIKDNIEWSHIPVILLTAKTDRAVKLEGMETGADAYIEKPFSLKLLQAQIENLLKSRTALKKKFSEMPFMPLHSVAGNNAEKQFLDKMNKIIEKNISNPDFSVDILAEQLYISRSGLFAKMKSLAGMTPNELIQLIRLKKAAMLLAGGELRVNEICYRVGFNSPSYFAKCFRKQFGMLPKDFVN